MNPSDLLLIAEALARGELRGRAGRPAQADLRKAVSTAYYALFNSLAQCCADMLVGATPVAREEEAWNQTYRALEHGFASNQCENRTRMGQFPEEVGKFGSVFAATQRQRQWADYDPAARFNRDDVLTVVGRAREAIAGLSEVEPRYRRAFAAHVLFRVRR